MKNRGFTLVELLATIVILAIIALIATPITMNIIESSKESAARISGNNLIEAVRVYFLDQKSTNKTIDVTSDSLDYKGTKPTKGMAVMNSDNQSKLYAYIKGYCVTKDYDEQTVNVAKTSIEECGWNSTNNYEIVQSEGNEKEIKGYKIYGNSYQEVRSGKNLFDETKYDELSEYTAASPYSYAVIQLESNTDYKVSVIRYNGFDGTGRGYLLISNIQGINGSTWSSIAHTTSPDASLVNYEYKTGSDGKLYIGYVTSTTPQENLDYIWANTDVQIEKGTQTTLYESYGQTPSPEIPSPITSLGRYNSTTNKYDIDIKTTGKNLFPYLYLTKYSYNDDYKNYNSKAAFLLSKGTYTFDTSNVIYVQFWDKNHNQINYLNVVSDYSPSFLPLWDNTGLAAQKSSYLTLTEDVIVTVCGTDENLQLQVEEGTVATNYESYKGTTTTISLDEPLRCVGDVCDYIDSSTSQIIRKVGKFVIPNTAIFNGISEDRILLNMGANQFDLNSINDMSAIWSYSTEASLNTSFLSSKYSIFYWYPDVTDFGVNPGDDNVSIKNNALQTWLSNQNEDTKTVYYVLKNPVREDIVLPDIPLSGVTNISASSDEISASKVEYYVKKQ